MQKKGVYVDLTKSPDLYDGLTDLSKKRYTSAASIVRQFIEKGLKDSGIKVSDKKIKVKKIEPEKV